MILVSEESFFSLAPVNLLLKRCTVWKILLNICLVTVTIIKRAQYVYEQLQYTYYLHYVSKWFDRFKGTRRAILKIKRDFVFICLFWYYLTAMHLITSHFIKTLNDFGIWRKFIFFSFAPVNLQLKRCTVLKILMKIWPVMITIIISLHYTVRYEQ